jgi:hypothetical protein
LVVFELVDVGGSRTGGERSGSGGEHEQGSQHGFLHRVQRFALGREQHVEIARSVTGTPYRRYSGTAAKNRGMSTGSR